MMIKVLTEEGLKEVIRLTKEYIDKRIEAHNKAIIMKECPTCGGHKFDIYKNHYVCCFCGNDYPFYTISEDDKKLGVVVTDDKQT